MEQKRWLNAVLLCFFLGGLGLHRKYLGYKNWWVFPITIGGGFGIAVLIDFVKLLKGSMKDAQGRELAR